MPPQLFVSNIAYNVGETELAQLFDRFKPTKVRLVLDRESGRSRGFAFVHFFDPSDAERAREELDGLTVWGRRLAVQPARERAPRPTQPRGDAER